MQLMKGKLILLASVLLNLLVTCTYGESASSVKADQSTGNLTVDTPKSEKSEKKEQQNLLANFAKNILTPQQPFYAPSPYISTLHLARNSSLHQSPNSSSLPSSSSSSLPSLEGQKVISTLNQGHSQVLQFNTDANEKASGAGGEKIPQNTTTATTVPITASTSTTSTSASVGGSTASISSTTTAEPKTSSTVGGGMDERVNGNTWPQYLSDDSDLDLATTDSSLFLAHGLQPSATSGSPDVIGPPSDPMDNPNLFQGDIVHQMNSESKTAVRIFNLWPLGIVPYTMDLTLIPIRDRIRSAMNEIESKTCVRFRPRLLSRDFVSMGSGSGCYSNIGRQGGGQVLSLGRGCHSHNTILHELLHAIGFEHMHSHRDRDVYLKIRWENIPKDKWRQFEVVSLLGYKAIIPFEFESVMLYGPKTFGENGKVTMESKLPAKRVMEMSEKPGLSQGDIDGINRLYFCRKLANGQWIHVATRKK